MKLSERLARLGTETAFEVLVRARALEAQGRSVVHLEIGEPDFDTPSHITDAAVAALKGGATHYGPAAGPARAAPGGRRGLDRAPRGEGDAGDGRRDAGRQAGHVLRDPRPRGPGRRGPLPEPRLPDLRVDDPLHRRRAGAGAAARGEGLRARRRPARSRRSRRRRSSIVLNYPHNPTGGIVPESGPARDRRRRGAPRHPGARRRDLLAHPLRRASTSRSRRCRAWSRSRSCSTASRRRTR